MQNEKKIGAEREKKTINGVQNEISVDNPTHDLPETAGEMVNKYGTYEIQPTNDTDNEFPTIAQGLPKKVKKPTVKPIKHSKESSI